MSRQAHNRGLASVSPFDDPDVTARLNAWAAALEKAVGTLNSTLEEVREYQARHQRGGENDGPAGLAPSPGERAPDERC